MSIWIKRIALAVISLGFGVAITLFEVTSDWSIGGRQFGLGTTLADYGPTYTFFTILAFACALGIILDKYMQTEILPS